MSVLFTLISSTSLKHNNSTRVWEMNEWFQVLVCGGQWGCLGASHKVSEKSGEGWGLSDLSPAGWNSSPR